MLKPAPPLIRARRFTHALPEDTRQMHRVHASGAREVANAERFSQRIIEMHAHHAQPRRRAAHR
jgi:hypothetical protein